MAKNPDKKQIIDFNYNFSDESWMKTPTEFKEGMYCYPAKTS